MPNDFIVEGILSAIIIVTIVILFFVYTPEGSLLETVLTTILFVTIFILILDLTYDIQNTKIFNHYFKATPNKSNNFNATKSLTNLTH